LSRVCPEHGPWAEVIWRGEPAFEKWRRPKAAAEGIKRQTSHDRGCPFDCGICPGHAQKSCAVLFEITGRCNLKCPVCFADVNEKKAETAFTPLPALLEQLRWIRRQAGAVVLQLSGGEPTLYPDLPSLVREAAALFPAVQLNTNGLRLAEKPALAHDLAEAGLSWVFLQFDGVSDRVFEIMRGRPLLEKKKDVVAACREAGLSVVLTPTVAAGINDGELGELVRLAISWAPTVRGVHIQPMTSSGRNHLAGAAHRLTLPETLSRLQEQTNGLVKPEQASPPGCEHERCSFHLRYRLTEGGVLAPLPGDKGCGCGPPDEAACSPAETERSLRRSIETVIRSWRQPAIPMAANAQTAPDAFDEFINKASRETFSITAMAFQDVWTVDLKRLQGCCVHVFVPPASLIPFCSFNLTSSDGRPLHRKPNDHARI
jgi:uncharacterized radical SAM superfamily Fe-S cluster-containing enzyme